MAVWLTAVLVGSVYALPLVLAYAHYGAWMHVSVEGDTFYSLRVVETARGGSLGNPYLWENQDAVRWLPGLAPAVLGNLSRTSGIPPLAVLAISRVLLPLAIFLLTYRLALELHLAPWLALVAASAPPLAPSVGHLFPDDGPAQGTGFLRYFRTISPPADVAFFLLALVLLNQAWKRGARVGPWILVAGAGLGLLAETPMFYWTVAFTGVATLAIVSPPAQRGTTLLVFLTGIVLASTSIYHSLQVFGDPDVQAALRRESQMVLQRAVETGALLRFAASWPPILGLWIFRKKFPQAAVFLLPFLVPSAFFFLQSLVTSREVEAYHWANPLIPLWCLGLAFGAQALWPRLDTARFALFGIGILAAAGAILQGASFKTWETIREKDPEFYSLDLRMPQTLAWLEERTSPESVVLSSDEIMTALPLFTHNRVFGADRAFFYAVSDSDAILRTHYEAEGPPLFRRPPPFRADYYLGHGPDVRPTDPGGDSLPQPGRAHLPLVLRAVTGRREERSVPPRERQSLSARRGGRAAHSSQRDPLLPLLPFLPFLPR